MQNLIKRQKNSRGFTLIELTFVLIVTGLLISIAIAITKPLATKAQLDNIGAEIDATRQVILTFYSLTGRYPCPADPTLDEGDAGYNMEDCSLSSTPGYRDIDGDGVMEPVLVGSMPRFAFNNADGTQVEDQKINLADLYEAPTPWILDFVDPWYKSMTYAVTESLTQMADYDPDNGVIRLRDELGVDGQNTGGVEDDAHFVLVSHGSVNECNPSSTYTAPVPGSTDPDEVEAYVMMDDAEEENCDGDAWFVQGLRNDSGGSNHYDDYIEYNKSENYSIWTLINGNTNLVRNKNSGMVSIGPGYDLDAPDTVKLDVHGNIRATNRTRMSKICDRDTGLCFQPETLYNLGCSETGQYMKSVEIDVDGNLIANCEWLTFGDSQSCSGDYYLNGIFSDGTADCVD